MKIKIHSSEVNRMMKTICQCIDSKIQRLGNICVTWDNSLLAIRGANGQFSAVMTTPLLGGDGESFCVDGAMFAKVCAMCSGEIEISTDGKVCTVKGAGRTRLPIVDVEVPAYQHVDGNSTVVSAEKFIRGYASVAHAISTNPNRIQLTGVLTEVREYGMTMVALDGFQMSIERMQCEGDCMTAIIPGALMKLIAQAAAGEADLTLRLDGSRIEAVADGMMISGGLLTGEYIDYKKILPKDFQTECLVKSADLLNALKSGSVVNSKQNLVRMEVSDGMIKVMNNSEEADYEAEIGCETQGLGLKIAFNQKYLMNTLASIGADEIVIRMNTATTPATIQGKDEDGVRLVLPVRVMGE